MLPLVEFVLEDGITDEEAIQILDLSIPKQKEEKKWQESRMGSILNSENQECLSCDQELVYVKVGHRNWDSKYVQQYFYSFYSHFSWIE